MNYQAHTETHTPTEKIILLSLRLNEQLTLDELMQITGTKTRKYMVRTLRTLVLSNQIQLVDETPTYKAVR